MSDLFTRQDYLNSPVPRDAAHRRYYAQLVDEQTIRQVVNFIGADCLLQSTDPHFNDIPLYEWDVLVGGSGKPNEGMKGRRSLLHCAMKFSELGDFATLAGLVCVAKEAARQYVEQTTKAVTVDVPTVP